MESKQKWSGSGSAKAGGRPRKSEEEKFNNIVIRKATFEEHKAWWQSLSLEYRKVVVEARREKKKLERKLQLSELNEKLTREKESDRLQKITKRQAEADERKLKRDLRIQQETNAKQKAAADREHKLAVQERTQAEANKRRQPGSSTTSARIPLQIDAKTTIYIRSDQDPQLIIQKYKYR